MYLSGRKKEEKRDLSVCSRRYISPKLPACACIRVFLGHRTLSPRNGLGEKEKTKVRENCERIHEAKEFVWLQTLNHFSLE